MDDGNDNGGIVRGSLAHRAMDLMRAAKGEFSASELAEQLHVDVSEARAALGTLRKACKVVTRVEEGQALYRHAAGSQGTRIAGSAQQPVRTATQRERRRTDPPAGESPAAQPAPPPAKDRPKKPITNKRAPRANSMRAKVLEMIGIEPGITAASLSSVLKQGPDEISRILWHLTRRGLVTAVGDKRPHGWRARENGDPPARRLTAGRPPRVQTPARAAPVTNLAQLGTQSPAPAKALSLAIDATGMVAIGNERLTPVEVRRVVEFLTLTQHVWQGAAA